MAGFTETRESVSEWFHDTHARLRSGEPVNFHVGVLGTIWAIQLFMMLMILPKALLMLIVSPFFVEIRNMFSGLIITILSSYTLGVTVFEIILFVRSPAAVRGFEWNADLYSRSGLIKSVAWFIVSVLGSIGLLTPARAVAGVSIFLTFTSLSFFAQTIYGWLVRKGESGPGVGAVFI